MPRLKHFAPAAIWLTLAFATSSFAQSSAGTNSPPTSAPASTSRDTSTTNGNRVQAGSSTSSETQSAITDVQARLDELTSNTSMDTTLKERLTLRYRAALEALRAAASDTETIAKLAKAASSASDNLAAAREALRKPAPAFTPPNDLAQLAIEELKQRRTESETALAAARQSLEAYEATERERESRRAMLPKLIADARANIEQMMAAPAPQIDEEPSGALKAAVDLEQSAKLRAQRQSLDALAQEQITIEAEADLLPAQVALSQREVDVAAQQLRFWTDRLGTQKQYQVENELTKHADHLSDQTIAPEQSLVLSLGKEWLELLREQSRLESKKTREQARYGELSQLLKSTQTEIERDMIGGRGLSSGLGLKLQLARNRLPVRSDILEEIAAMDESIDHAQSLQTRLEIAIEDSRRETSLGLPLRPDSNLPIVNGAVDTNEVNLLKQLKTDVDQHLNSLVEIKGALELKLKLVSDIHRLIESHVIWIRNASTFHWSDFSDAWWTFRRIIHPIHLKAAAVAIRTGLINRIDLIIVWGIFALSIWLGGSRLRRRLTEVGLSAKAGKLDDDLHYSIRPTVIALLITVLLALPLVVTLAVVAYSLLEEANKDLYLSSVGSAFLTAAVALFPIEMLRQVLRPGGLAIAHFGYRNEIVLPPRSSLRLMINLGIPMLILWGVANESSRSPGDVSLARLIFAIGMTVLSYLLWRSLHPSSGLLADYLQEHSNSWTSRLSRLWHPLIASLPTLLAVLALLGYVYTATLLTGRLYWTLWLAIAVLVTGGMLRQWFVTYRRRVAMMRLPENSTQTKPVDGSPIEVKIESPIDVKEMDAQSLRLIQAMLWVAGLVGTVLIWSPVFPAVHFLDGFMLWPSIAADGSVVPVTLANLVIAIPIVVLSFIAVRNVPGLLESVLLERLPIDRPARYAITTLASYALAVIGIILSAKTLGLRWESIQWLVAALGVGLGFGLQEIFANFISGLILLFEQPIRVGDVVTIDGVTGTVSKIRMRATVVTNGDLQELIIPNKDLITGRIVNWTLSDSTNRLTLNVGIAYGSDTRKACQIVEQICAQHENLLVDPAPLVTFESFGDSSLNLVVRCFLGALDERLQTLHELNTSINDRFAAEGIEIAFPQRDLRIRSVPDSLRPLLQSTASVSTPPS
jgi:potassium-dependent mechanosensitive channel